ncbi:hypothetical protein LYZ96_23280 [Xanthomonas hortorum pv. vitians]|nr:hypothetical protein [Xanthomonas hortorum pv. vitians]
MAEDPKIQTRLSGPTRHPALSGLVIQTFLNCFDETSLVQLGNPHFPNVIALNSHDSAFAEEPLRDKPAPE